MAASLMEGGSLRVDEGRRSSAASLVEGGSLRVTVAAEFCPKSYRYVALAWNGVKATAENAWPQNRSLSIFRVGVFRDSLGGQAPHVRPMGCIVSAGSQTTSN